MVKHLYIHIPFCKRRCSYCDFAIAIRKSVPSQQFVDAVLREWETRRANGEADLGTLETLYLGGGTPSLLSPHQLARLVGAFDRMPDAEVTLEANPDDATPEAARAWREAGVNRVSLGAQSFSPEVLSWMHRTHSAQATAVAVANVRDAGIESVSLDLIFGLPPAVESDLGRDLSLALELNPDHLSLYGLTVEPRTPVARWIARGHTVPVADAGYVHEFKLAHRVLEAAGFDHYEISNYARITSQGTSARSRHNSAYWIGDHYTGLGPSAHGFTGDVRRWNLREWTAYQQQVEAGQDPVAGSERLTADQAFLEQLYLGLRTAEGLTEQVASQVDAGALVVALEREWLTEDSGWVSATLEGWLLLDALVTLLTT